MNETKHTPTPGPWYVAGTGNHQGLIISESTAANVAVAYDKKDAPLLAAAPELLEALQYCARYFHAIDTMQPDKGHGTEGAAVRRATLAAIAKAGGAA